MDRLSGRWRDEGAPSDPFAPPRRSHPTGNALVRILEIGRHEGCMNAEPQFIRTILVAADLSLLLFLVLLVSVGLWALRGTLPKDVRDRYPKRVGELSQLPFPPPRRGLLSTKALPL